MIGTIRSFSPKHGFGFVEVGNKDLFFHIKDWLSPGRPNVGDEVKFTAHKTPRGFKAKKVRKI